MGLALHTKVIFVLKGHPVFGVAQLDRRLETVLKALKGRGRLARDMAKRVLSRERPVRQRLLLGKPRSCLQLLKLSPEGVSRCGRFVHEGVGPGQAGSKRVRGGTNAFLGLAPGWDGRQWKHATCRTQGVHVTWWNYGLGAGDEGR